MPIPVLDALVAHAEFSVLVLVTGWGVCSSRAETEDCDRVEYDFCEKA